MQRDSGKVNIDQPGWMVPSEASGARGRPPLPGAPGCARGPATAGVSVPRSAPTAHHPPAYPGTRTTAAAGSRT
jgi:hypothetical protein